MDSSIAPLAAQFLVGTRMVTAALAELDAAVLAARPGPHSNPVIWIAGHLTQFRARLAALLGEPIEAPWEPLFSTGCRVADSTVYPPAGDVLARWNELAPTVAARLDRVTAAELDGPPSRRAASTDGTLRGAIALFAFHEAYHIGQLGYLRKWLGKGSLFD
ncbi:MAG TPA: DinB family protein [Gemmatimonadaceae bacterium]|nr:DinB family protein [Gemmatimonadaceae bacterium]